MMHSVSFNPQFCGNWGRFMAVIPEWDAARLLDMLLAAPIPRLRLITRGYFRLVAQCS